MTGMPAGGSNRGTRCGWAKSGRESWMSFLLMTSGDTMRADGEVQRLGGPCWAVGARAFPRCWNMGEGWRAPGLRVPSAIPTDAGESHPEESDPNARHRVRRKFPTAEFRDGEPDPTSPLRITLPRPLHLPSGGAPKRASRLRGSAPCASRGPVWGLFTPPRATGICRHACPGSR